MKSIGANKEQNAEPNQLIVPSTPSRQYRSKSVSLSALHLDDAKITVDVKNSEILITPTGSKKFTDPEKSAQFCDIEDKLNIGDKITQVFGNFQDGLQMLSEYRSNTEDDKVGEDADTKLTIRGPGSYIKKLIQQFSEGTFEAEDSKPESERAKTIKDKAGAICKKCLHYKGNAPK